MSDHQDLILASLLTLVTDPEQVARNIRKLQEDKLAIDRLIKKADEAKHAAEKRHSEASAKEIDTVAFKTSLDNRDTELKKLEEHWASKDAQQKETEKQFNEEKTTHEAHVRDVAARETAANHRHAELDKREKDVVALEEKARQHESDAAAFKNEHEERLAKLKSFVGGVA